MEEILRQYGKLEIGGEYRRLVEDFMEWCRKNKCQLKITKTKELLLDFQRVTPSLLLISTDGKDAEVVSTYKYLCVHLDKRLSWLANTDNTFACSGMLEG